MMKIKRQVRENVNRAVEYALAAKWLRIGRGSHEMEYRRAESMLKNNMLTFSAASLTHARAASSHSPTLRRGPKACPTRMTRPILPPG
ncbi:MAG: hypothetical protein GC146_10275 [Limimaricola sp.]|uniref:hypothetical protein n=1 Tax=Limimaricola sp. TaxID=2211665 RepID=UPI001D2CF098|nr:hypothetical protein [Limimaricola sp.]MBI1417595.1 hypothetical protein [Limimaricola sp.]